MIVVRMIAAAATTLTLAGSPVGGGSSHSGLLAPPEVGFRDAQSHVPSLLAQLLAGQWEQAIDELQVIRRDLALVHAADDLNPALKRRVARVTPLLAKLDQQLARHDQGAHTSATALAAALDGLARDPLMRRWLGGSHQTYP